MREGFTFDCDLASYVVKRVVIDGEIRVWVSSGLKTLKIKHNKLGPYELYMSNYNIRVDPWGTYKVVLQGTGLTPNPEPLVTQQYLAFELTPANAILYVNGQLWEVGSDGSAMKFVDFGTYDYRVEAPNYHPKTGSATVNDPKNTHKEKVTLEPDFVQITFVVDADAEIWVNNERKGIRTWTGPLGKGSYKVECKQKGHETMENPVQVTADMNGKTINLTAPKPVYGSLSVESTPNFAKLYIDGMEVGESPKFVSELLVGEHEIKLVKDGYAEYKETVVIAKGERKQMKATLSKGQSDEAAIPYVIPAVNTEKDETFTVNGVSFKMKFVEGGTFPMGATSEQGNDAESDEKPIHSVTLGSYLMGETEVTQALWKAVMESNHSYWEGDNLPVERVSWNDIQVFITELNRLTSKRFRLPTEAEWEFAARGGKQGKGYKYAGSNTLGDVAWYDDNSGSQTHAVKTKSPNELGLYDMSGNVFEWCSD